MDGELGDAGDWPGGDQAGFECPVNQDGETPGQAQFAVEPRVEQGPAIDFDPHLVPGQGAY